MSYMHIATVTKGATPGVFARHRAKINKASFYEDGVFWHASLRGKHFTKEGAREYGYAPRKGEPGNPHPRGFKQSYTGRKLKKYGHTLPMVHSGLSRDHTRIRDVRATSKGCRVVMRAPTLNLRNPASRINMRDEMTRISLPDRDQILTVHTKTTQRGIDRVRETTTRRHG